MAPKSPTDEGVCKCRCVCLGNRLDPSSGMPAPTPRMPTFRMMLSLAAHEGWHILATDCTQAFANAKPLDVHYVRHIGNESAFYHVTRVSSNMLPKRRFGKAEPTFPNAFSKKFSTIRSPNIVLTHLKSASPGNAFGNGWYARPSTRLARTSFNTTGTHALRRTQSSSYHLEISTEA
jgi:hypothetical protein